VLGERGAEGGDVDAVGADGLVQEFGGHLKLFSPVGDVGGDLGLDLVEVHGDLVVVLGLWVLDGFGGGDDVGHAVVPLFRFSVVGCTEWSGGVREPAHSAGGDGQREVPGGQHHLPAGGYQLLSGVECALRGVLRGAPAGTDGDAGSAAAGVAVFYWVRRNGGGVEESTVRFAHLLLMGCSN